MEAFDPAAERCLESLSEVCPLPFVEWDTALHVARWSHAAEADFGWCGAEVLGQPPEEWRFIPASELGRTLEALKEVITFGSRTVDFHGRVRNRDGATIACKWYIGARPDDAGCAHHLFAFIVPSADSDKPAHASAQHWQRFFRGSRLGLALHDTRSNRVVEANPAYARLHGYTIAELRGKRVDELYPESEQDALSAFLKRADSEGEISFESVHVRRDGSRFPVLMGMTSITDDKGEPVERYVSLIDISDRKAAEEKLRILSRAIEESPESIVITNTHAEIEYVNPACIRKSGYTLHELLGQNPRILGSDKTPRDTYASLWETLARGTVWTGEFRNRNKDGHEYLERATISPIHDDTGTVTHYVAVKEDITGQRRMEEELARHQEQLEHLVETRTRELRVALDAASTASRAKGEFLATMSHEIRTPMNGVVGIVDVLARTRLTSDQQDMVGTMRQSAVSLLKLIDDILDLSKIEAGLLATEMQPLALETLLDEIADSLQPMARERGVDLRAFVAPELPALIIGDPFRLRQIIVNLAGNAIKFSSGQSLRGRVMIRAEPGGAHALRLSISDNGIGMSEDELDKVFEPFTQAEQSTTRRFGGTGLGLTISRRLVDMLGGSIRLESTPGKGTCAIVNLPLRVAETGRCAERPLEGMHCVLYLSEHNAACDWRAYLQDAGARARIATNLGDAIRLLSGSTRGARVLLTDAALSGRLTEAWRQLTSENRPGLVMVGHGMRRNARREADRAYSIDLEAARRQNIIEAVQLAAGGEALKPLRGPALRNTASCNEELLRHLSELALRLDPVLVVEDHDINRKVIGRQLDLLGLGYRMASNGVEALEALAHNRFALVLTDLHMPDMDGYALVASVRETEPSDEHLPIIAITANALRGEEQRCLAAGMDAFLVKPVQLEALAEVVVKVLGATKNPSHRVATDEKTAHDLRESAPGVLRPAADESSPVLETQVLQRLIGDKKQMMIELLGAYRLSAMRSSEEILRAARLADWAGVGAGSHKLKSASRSVGASALGELCEIMEAHGRSSDESAMNALLPTFEPLVQETLKRIELEMETLAAAGPAQDRSATDENQ